MVFFMVVAGSNISEYADGDVNYARNDRGGESDLDHK